MKDYRSILHRVGWVLIISGLIDIGILVYCIANRICYASSINIFAVIAGLFLLKGSLKAALVISSATAFFIAAGTGLLVLLPCVLPFDLLLTYIKLKPATAAAAVVYSAVIMALLVWVYRELTSQPLRVVMNEAGVNCTWFGRKPARGFWIGGCFVLFLLLVFSLLMGGPTADEAKRRAAAQVGEGYKFHVRSLSTSSTAAGKHVHAVVIAYNNTEIKDVVVQWSE